MSAGEDFIQDLIDAMPTPHAQMLLTARLAKYAGCTVYIPAQSKAERRILAACNMLKNNMASADIAEAIRERFQVSLRTAQRDVSTARKMAGKLGAASL